MEFFEQLTGPLGGMFALGVAVGGGGVFGLFRRGIISSSEGVKLKSDLAAMTEALKNLKQEVEDLKSELEPWREFQSELAQEALANKRS